eukprot:4965369-Amphidinium_carterae.1
MGRKTNLPQDKEASHTLGFLSNSTFGRDHFGLESFIVCRQNRGGGGTFTRTPDCFSRSARDHELGELKDMHVTGGHQCP